MRKIRIMHVVQAAGGVDRYIRMLLKYLDKEKFENILICSQDFHKADYDGLVDCFEQIEMNRAIGMSDLKSIREVRNLIKKYNPDIVYAHSSVLRILSDFFFLFPISNNDEMRIRNLILDNICHLRKYIGCFLR